LHGLAAHEFTARVRLSPRRASTRRRPDRKAEVPRSLKFFATYWLATGFLFCPGTTHFNLRPTKRGLALVAGTGIHSYLCIGFSNPASRRARMPASTLMGVTSDGGKFIAYIVGRFCNRIAPRERQRAQQTPLQSHSADPYRCIRSDTSSVPACSILPALSRRVPIKFSRK
jgi:hypothetical protein